MSSSERRRGTLTGGMSNLSISKKKKKSKDGKKVSSSSSRLKKKDADKKKMRRRLSVTAGAAQDPLAALDGVTTPKTGKKSKRVEKHGRVIPKSSGSKPDMVYTKYASLSKVGYVPFNPSKVNQDRACEVVKYTGDPQRAFFGVFDGHGSLGHHVSQYVSTNLPKFIQNVGTLDANPEDALTKGFVSCNAAVAKGSIDCTFSGTTVVTCYLNGRRMYCANAGDSRAVLGTQDGNKIKAINLSDDQKPERKDEAERIIENNGRVEACKGMNGEDIGPMRVWLLNQDVPGLAMTRSFGDLIAASVGVIPVPEIKTHDIGKNDQFMILGSDGIWEFISSQDACDLIQHCKTPEDACELLVKEATTRWEREEEVIDDITALVVFFK